MRYTVVWLNSAQNHLAAIWTDASDKAEVAAASNAIDRSLAVDPYRDSESRSGNDRVMFVRPLAVRYTVSAADRMVTVHAVWRI